MLKIFLDIERQAGTEEDALLNLYYDACLFSWSISTVQDIDGGIKSTYAKGGAEDHALESWARGLFPGKSYDQRRTSTKCA